MLLEGARAETSDGSDDLVGGFGPDERHGTVVGCCDVVLDRVFELASTTMIPRTVATTSGILYRQYLVQLWAKSCATCTKKIGFPKENGRPRRDLNARPSV